MTFLIDVIRYVSELYIRKPPFSRLFNLRSEIKFCSDLEEVQVSNFTYNIDLNILIPHY